MTADPQTRVRAAVRAHVDGLRVPPGDLVAVIIAAGRSGPRRADPLRRLMPAVATAAALLVLLGVAAQPALVEAFPHEWLAGAGGPATLPDRIARYSYVTAAVSKSPPGRAIALYQQGLGMKLLDRQQVLVVGADRDVYRRVDAAERRGGPLDPADPAPMLLSPDGSRVAIGSHAAAADLAVVDLSTGRARSWPAAPRANLVPLAWSPDGRYVAALEMTKAFGPYAGSPGTGTLVLFDLAGRGRLTLRGDPSGVSAAAFSPDGGQLAMQRAKALVITDLQGKVLRTIETAGRFGTLTGAAWSPDGEMLALALGPGTADVFAITFIGSRTESIAEAKAQVEAGSAPLGWTSARQLVVLENGHDITEVDVDTGDRERLSRIDTGPGGNFQVAHLQLAVGLLAGVRVRDAAGADRGPWPLWFRAAVILILVAVAGTVAFGLRRARRRSRRSVARSRRPALPALTGPP